MEETEESTNNGNNNNNTFKKCNGKTKSLIRGKKQSPLHNHQYHHQKQYQYQFQYLNQYQYQYPYQYHHLHNHNQLFQYPNQTPMRYYQEEQALLPLPRHHNPNPIIPLHLSLPPNKNLHSQSFKKPPCKLQHINPSISTIEDNKPVFAAKRPDSGGEEGHVIALMANHFLVKLKTSRRIYHYNVEIVPRPSSKELARSIKSRLVIENPEALSGAKPAFDGSKNLFSPIEFRDDNLELYIALPIVSKLGEEEHVKLFRVNIKLVSKLEGDGLGEYLGKEGEDHGNWVPLPQDYLQALDVVLRESSLESCFPVGRSLYPASMAGARDIGGGAVGLRGFFQSLRPTQQGLALNVDFSVTAFHESIGVIPYLQKRVESLRDLSRRKTRGLVGEERREVERALKNVRVFVCHRETAQRYRVSGLTDEATEDLWFDERDGKRLRLMGYFKDQYNYDIQYRNLPCLQIGRSKPCYLPMELCMICEGQKFLGKLSDDQTARMLKMGCQRPKERRAIIDGVMQGNSGPASGNQGREFDLEVSKEMTRLNGRVLQPPRLRLGDGGHVRELTPNRHDRQWNFSESHVLEGTRIDRWALISFGGSPEQRSSVPRFISQLCHRCEQLGIYLNKSTINGPQFEPTQVLNDSFLLETKLKRISTIASDDLQLVVCVMERRHRGYADLKRIAETSVGVVTQCCLYQNLARPGSQFLANLALKINAKIGGSTVALYNSLPTQIPRLLGSGEPVIFFGADVTHPHPLDDSSPSVAALVGTANWPAANKYVTRMRSQTHRQEIVQDLEAMVSEILEEFRVSVGKLPERIVFFRDGVSETQFQRVLREELRAVKTACARFSNYNPPVTFAVVQKRHHTRLFPVESDENVPPGTVVDTVIAHPREFDFFLCSHWGVKGTSRPTHYHVLCDESGFTSDELQRLVYSLCFTYARCTKPVSLVPPAYYAHLAAYRGRLYLEKSSSFEYYNRRDALSRPGAPKTVPLPKLSDNLKKLMFYC